MDNPIATTTEAILATFAGRALTLIRPWDTAIIRLGKPVENRGWAPPAKLLGQRIAIHGGLKFDHEAAETIRLDLAGDRDESRRWEELIEKASEGDGGSIIGTVLLVRWFNAGMSDPLEINRWFSGPKGWVLAEPIALPEPVPCRGALGLWTVPPQIAARVLDQEARGRNIFEGRCSLSPQPKPGSAAALALGCTCPVLDNGHGMGRGDGNFVRVQGCPVHDPRPDVAAVKSCVLCRSSGECTGACES